MSLQPKDQLESVSYIWHRGVERVKGQQCTRQALNKIEQSSWRYILAMGKAASSMMRGALDNFAPDGKALVVTKYEHSDVQIAKDSRITVFECGHPVPDRNSLIAGQAATEFVRSIPEDASLLVLVSGGASALVELLTDDKTLSDLQDISHTLLADGFSIDQINSIRIQLSKIKGGKLLRQFNGQRIQVFGLSDIPGDDASLIGSGIAAIEPPQVLPFSVPDSITRHLANKIPNTTVALSQPGFEFNSIIIGSNRIARDEAVCAGEEQGLNVVISEEALTGDVLTLAQRLGQVVANGDRGVYIWGGEPTVQLPENPGCGGRNQSLAIALAIELNEVPNVCGVVAGTDGTDGPTDAAGGMFYSGMPLQGARQAIEQANAYQWLEKSGVLFSTGPTGTNVMDLAVVIKE